jgi:hypothetical protein
LCHGEREREERDKGEDELQVKIVARGVAIGSRLHASGSAAGLDAA